MPLMLHQKNRLLSCLFLSMCMLGAVPGIGLGAPLVTVGAADDFVVPKQVIQGAETPVALGEMVDLSLSSVGEKIPHLERSVYSWMILDGATKKRVREVDGGVFFGAGLKNKTLFAICYVTHLYVVKDDKGVVTKVGVRNVTLSTPIVIGTGDPDTPPNPPTPPTPPVPPTPTPEPDFPDGTFKLSKFCYRAANVSVTDVKSRQDGAKALTKSFEGVAAAIAAGAYKEPKQILEETAKANKKALTEAGVPVATWDTFLTSLQDYLYDLHKGGKLRLAADYQVAWAEVAGGLARIR